MTTKEKKGFLIFDGNDLEDVKQKILLFANNNIMEAITQYKLINFFFIIEIRHSIAVCCSQIAQSSKAEMNRSGIRLGIYPFRSFPTKQLYFLFSSLTPYSPAESNEARLWSLLLWTETMQR